MSKNKTRKETLQKLKHKIKSAKSSIETQTEVPTHKLNFKSLTRAQKDFNRAHFSFILIEAKDGEKDEFGSD